MPPTALYVGNIRIVHTRGSTTCPTLSYLSLKVRHQVAGYHPEGCLINTLSLLVPAKIWLWTREFYCTSHRCPKNSWTLKVKFGLGTHSLLHVAQNVPERLRGWESRFHIE